MLLRLGAVCLFLALTADLAHSQTAPSPAMESGDGFGGAVAVAGNTIFAGSAPAGWQTGSKPAGAVYGYQKNEEGDWVEVVRLKASDGRVGDHFGRSLAAMDNRVVVGAPGAGAAYVFDRGENGDWAETAKLQPSSMADGAEFGGSYARAAQRSAAISMSAGQIVVASFHAGTSRGAVHVFRNETGAWMEEAILVSDLTEDGDRYAWSVLSDDSRVFVGAPAALNRAGAIHVFERMEEGGDWGEFGQIVDPAGEAGDGLGYSVIGRNGTVISGAPGRSRILTFSKDDSLGDWVLSGEIESESRGAGIYLAHVGSALVVAAQGAIDIHAGELVSVLDAPDDRSALGFGQGVAAGQSMVVVGSPSADYGDGLATVFEVGDSGDWLRTATLASELDYLDSITGRAEIECEEGDAAGFSCDGVDLVSFLSVKDLASSRGVKMTDIWGWEDPETGKEWVLQARTEGVSFVDISNPAMPVYVGQILKTEGSPGATWRDVKVYMNHAYIVADGSEAHGVQIFDLTQLRDVDPGDMPVTFEETAHYGGVHSTHNIVINEETGFAYAVGNRAGGETCGGQLHMIDVREPANPQFAGCYSFDGAGGTHDAQCVIYGGPDADFEGQEICFNSNGSIFIIADVTDKEHPLTLANTSYPLQAYTHQGWLTEDQRYFYMNDELDEMNDLVPRTRTLIWDVQDLEDPQLVSEFLLDSGASDHNLYIRGNLMYQSNYQAGLRILDISEPLAPVEVGNFDTAPFAEDAPGFGGSWSNYPYFKSGVIAVSSRSEGLFLLRKQQRDL